MPLASYPLITKTTLISQFANSILSLPAGRERCALQWGGEKKISLIRLALCGLCQNDWTEVNHQPLPEQRGRVLWTPVFPLGKLSLAKEAEHKRKMYDIFFLPIVVSHCKNGVYISWQRIINQWWTHDLLKKLSWFGGDFIPLSPTVLFPPYHFLIFTRETKDYNINLDPSSSSSLNAVFYEKLFFFKRYYKL